MSAQKLDNNFFIHNPYREGFCPKTSKELEAINPSFSSSLLTKATSISTKVLFDDFEKEVSTIGKVTSLAETVTNGFMSALKAIIIGCSFFHFHFMSTDFLVSFASFILKTFFFPFSIFLLSTSLLGSFFSLSQLSWVSELLSQIRKGAQVPLASRLEWVQNNFFRLSPYQVSKVYEYVEKILPSASAETKEARFDKIAAQVLKNNYSLLQRRVTSRFADSLSKKIGPILANLNSEDPEIKKAASLAGENLLKNMKIQCKKKMLFHYISLFSLGLSIISGILILSFCSAGAVLIALGILGVLAFILQYLLEKGVLSQEGWSFSLKACLPFNLGNTLFPNKEITPQAVDAAVPASLKA